MADPNAVQIAYWKRLLTSRTDTLRKRAERAETEAVWLRSVLDRWGIDPGRQPEESP